MTTRDRYRFFHENAGGVVGRRAESALALARAETWLEDVSGLHVEVEPCEVDWRDSGPQVPRPDDPQYHDFCSWRSWWERSVESGALVVEDVRLVDDAGQTVAALHGVDHDPSDGYLRLVVAELASEVMPDPAPDPCPTVYLVIGRSAFTRDSREEIVETVDRAPGGSWDWGAAGICDERACPEGWPSLVAALDEAETNALAVGCKILRVTP